MCIRDRIHNLEVDMFGGEPLLNFDVVREPVSYTHLPSGFAPEL